MPHSNDWALLHVVAGDVDSCVADAKRIDPDTPLDAAALRRRLQGGGRPPNLLWLRKRNGDAPSPGVLAYTVIPHGGDARQPRKLVAHVFAAADAAAASRLLAYVARAAVNGGHGLVLHVSLSAQAILTFFQKAGVIQRAKTHHEHGGVVVLDLDPSIACTATNERAGASV